MTRHFTALILILFLFATSLLSCSSGAENSSPTLPTGVWRATLKMQGQTLPFTFRIAASDGTGYQAFLQNGEEEILVDEVVVEGDSIHLPMHIFDTQIDAQIQGDSLLGYWTKNYTNDYRIPFTAVHGEAYRFTPASSENPVDVGGTWAVYFAGDSLPSVGVFEQDGSHLTGSFLTTTGDYRFLEGQVNQDELMLSTFDGEHAFLFKATWQEDSILQGDFWSGKSYHTTWTAHRDDDAALPDANQLTYLKNGYDRLAFTFPNLEGQPVSISDKQYQGKVVIVQLFGTWCPNCMDETKFYTDWYQKNKDRGVEIIGLAYEQKDDFDYARRRVQRMVNKLNVPYDFLIAGVADKEIAAQTLPMLNHVMSFPTSIYVGRDGHVKGIHTGFSGPGTGVYYDRFVQEFNARMDTLLSEQQ